MFDTLIVGGTIVDGTGNPRYKADVGITNGKITAIGSLSGSQSKRTIDATQHVVSPGFIDMHTHSDVTLLDDPCGESKAYQGVTTEVTGNCSYSPFPSGIGGAAALKESLGQTLVSKIDWKWSSLDEWAEDLETEGISLNVAPQVGNAALRVAAGAKQDGEATDDQLGIMKKLALESVEQGAFSLSTGLSLAPSGYATTHEIIELCKAISGYEGVFYVTHARVGPGRHISMIEEAVEIGQKGGVPVQFSHMAITDWRHYGEGPEMISVIEKAREESLDMTYDMYPYIAAGAGLDQTIPLWAQAGTLNEYMDRLRDPQTRQRILEGVAEGIGHLSPKWDTWVVSLAKTDSNKRLVGMSIKEIAEDRGVAPEEAVLQLTEEEGGVVPVTVYNRKEDDIRYFMGHPLAMIGSDGSAVSPEGLHGDAMPHPRYYGTYPRILGRYVREKPSVLSLESAIHKMTGFPSERLIMKERGLIKENYIADVVIFDPDTIIDCATFEDPHQYPKGIPHVIVNGQSVIQNGKHTGSRPGKVLRRGNT